MEAAESLPPDGEAAPEVTTVPSGAPAGEQASLDDLSPREREILDFERRWWRYAGAKEQAIREQFGLSATRYYQLLNRLLEKPAALRADPMLVKRLHKTRSTRSRKRIARRLGIEAQ
ncbi:DUF3263 domain-containing protein [Amycolatopsis taiwanensis]|uniref:DUF3263 domain-containing protein n=1 Tax=Amycolatopsis taiwanensis TaxID=342230 RepID=A0A9W6RBE4_9PSEU|nr:DUF3263 domain-containing protein [Amycolatopsis taiwanensis]GLY71655.1 hypothetical protein Atai01_82740 [Amycolatopsis taiwanensis]